MTGWVDTYLLDGVDLGTRATWVDSTEGLTSTPAAVGEDPEVSGADGLLPVWGGPGQPRRADSASTLTLSVALLGVDPITGRVTAGASTEAQWFAAWDALARMLRRRRLRIDHPRPDGATRRATGYVTSVISPSREVTDPWYGRAQATITIPSGRWTDITPVTTGALSVAAGGVVSLAAWQAATAVCTDLRITFGPGAPRRLVTSYAVVGWSATIPTGRELVIDTATGLTSAGPSGGWTPGYDALEVSPGPGLWEIDPAEPLTAVLDHSAGTPLPVQISGPRHYSTS